MQLSNTDDFEVITFVGETIPAGGQSTFRIAFHPATLGVKTCEVTIASTDDDEPAYTFTLQGNCSGVALDRFEPNDDRFDPFDLGILGYRSETQLSIHSALDEDWFSFTAEAGGTATLTTSRTDVFIELRDDGGGMLETSVLQGQRQVLTYDVALGTQYCVRVYAGLTAVNQTYDLAIEAPTAQGNAIHPTAGYSFTDHDGDLVTVKLTGGGTGTVYLLDATAPASDMHRIVLQDTGFASMLTVSVIKAGNGYGRTNVVDIIAQGGSLKSIHAPSTNLLGNVLIDGSLRTLTLADAMASYKLIQLCRDGAEPTEPAAQFALTLGRARDITLDTGLEPVASITAVEWMDTDTVPDTITAPSIGKLSITGQVGNMALGTLTLAGDFQVNLQVGSAGLKTVTPLGELTVAGMMGLIQVRVQGYDARGQSIKKLNITYAGSPAFNVDGGIAALTTNDWLAGSIQAGWIGSLITTPTTMGRAGRLGADLILSGANTPARKPSLANVKLGGPWLPSKVQIQDGYAGTIAASGLVDQVELVVQGVDAKGQSIAKLQLANVESIDITAAGGIGALATNQWLGGLIRAGWIGTLTSTAGTADDATGDVGVCLILSGSNLPAGKAALATVKIGRDLLSGTAWDILSGYVGSVKVGRTAIESEILVRGWNNKGQSIGSFQAAGAQSTDITADAGIGSLKVANYDSGNIAAGWIGTLTAAANAALHLEGDVTGVSLELTGARCPAKKPSLGTVKISGGLESSVWDVLAGGIGTARAYAFHQSDAACVGIAAEL